MRSYAECFMDAFVHDSEIPPRELWEDPDWMSLWQVREHLVPRARSAALERGESYREFRVGAAAFLSSTEPALLRGLGRPPQAIYTGSNCKLGQDERNTCAEQEIRAQIRQQQHLFPPKEVLALAIAGEAQDEPDRESGLVTATLHPCNHCRKLLRATPYMKPDTVIITAGLTTDAMEVMRFEELLRLHGLEYRAAL